MKGLKSWFRYHHFNTHPALELHAAYIAVLSQLEGMADTHLGEAGDMDQGWKEILSALNSLSHQDAIDLDEFRKRQMNNAKF